MSTKYRLLDHIPWPYLHGQRIKLEISENYVIAVMSDGSFHVLAQSVKPRGKRQVAEPNGLDGLPSAEQLTPAPFDAISPDAQPTGTQGHASLTPEMQAQGFSAAHWPLRSSRQVYGDDNALLAGEDPEEP